MMLHQLSYPANRELVVMWVDDKTVDDGYMCVYLTSIHGIHVTELQIEMIFQCKILTVMRPT